MIQVIKTWIIEIATVVLFITAVEMLLPNNSLKKYSKFVLGLILMTVLINPLIKLVNNDFNINVYSESISKVMGDENHEKNLNEYRKKTLKRTSDNFEHNLENIISEKLKNKFPQGKYKVEAKVNFDDKNNRFNIKKVNIEVRDKTIDKVKKVSITLKEKNGESNEDSKFLEMKNYLNNELGILHKLITIYKV